MRFLVLLLCLQPALLSAAPRVVTSIAPLHEITSAIMTGIATPQLVIESHHSAHHFAFKPSHLRRLQQADLVIWVDRYFEAGFNRVPEMLADSTRRLELLPALGIDNGDGHFWYSPRLLQMSITMIGSALTDVDPSNRADYLENAKRLNQAIAGWRQRFQHRWQDASLRLLTDHGFLSLFAADLKLFEIAAIQDHHDAQGGLRDLDRVEKWLGDQPSACLLTLEPTASPLATSLATKYRLRIVNAIDTSHPPNTILRRLEQLESALEICQQQTTTAAE
ncbi:MAG: metal ABC transporter substrate-binding protein [Gammaproteobacteria bacterium]|nr:metal ABC transporter substrate-binding protein [Gammaproteobacteria bacterium]